MAFSQPSGPGGDSFAPADHNGHLVLVYPKSYQDEVQTKNGASSAAEVDVVIVDKLGPDGKPIFFQNARLFGNLARSVRNDIGGQVLGRLGQGPNTRGTPPWILQNFTDGDVLAATPVDTAYRQGVFKPTENPMSAPAAATPPAVGAQQWAPPQQQQQQWQATQTLQGQPQQWQAPPAPAAPTPTPAAAPPQQWNPGPAAPAPQQWQPGPAVSAPTPAPIAAPPAAPAAAVDPNLVQYLKDRGVNVTPDMDQATCEGIARSFPS